MIAMALSCDLKLLIADEPTTALDVTVQAQILDLISDLAAELGSAAVIIIAQDLGVVAELADDVLVMHAGKAVEYGTAEDIFTRPRASLHLGAAWVHAPPGPGTGGSADPDQGNAAQPHQRAAWLLVPPPLPLCGPHRRPERGRGPIAARDLSRPPQRLPPAGRPAPADTGGGDQATAGRRGPGAPGVFGASGALGRE